MKLGLGKEIECAHTQSSWKSAHVTTVLLNSILMAIALAGNSVSHYFCPAKIFPSVQIMWSSFHHILLILLCNTVCQIIQREDFLIFLAVITVLPMLSYSHNVQVSWEMRNIVRMMSLVGKLYDSDHSLKVLLDNLLYVMFPFDLHFITLSICGE